MLQAGYKVNVIPGEAVGHVDGRVLPGYEAEFEAAMDELTGPDVGWEYTHREVPLEAPLDAPLMAAMTSALLAEDPQSRIVPYCMAGGADAKRFSRLGIAGYGFTRSRCRRVRLPRDVPRRGRAHPGDRAALRRAGDGPTTDDGELIR